MPLSFFDKEKVAFIVGIITDCMRQLFEYNDDTNSCQHPFDNVRGKIVRDSSSFGNTE